MKFLKYDSFAESSRIYHAWYIISFIFSCEPCFRGDLVWRKLQSTVHCVDMTWLLILCTLNYSTVPASVRMSFIMRPLLVDWWCITLLNSGALNSVLSHSEQMSWVFVWVNGQKMHHVSFLSVVIGKWRETGGMRGKAQRDDQQVLMVHHACHCGSKYRPYHTSLVWVVM